MSEKIYALLLRLFPARFRSRYQEESLQLLRDRLRDETGFPARLRLWLDLLGDLAISLPREYRALRPAVGVAAPPQRIGGLPSFDCLERPAPRPATLLFASALALAGAGGFFILLNYAGPRPHYRLSTIARRAQAQPAPSPAAPASSVSGPPLPADETGESAAVASTAPQPADRSQAPAQSDANPATLQITPTPLDPAERHRVVAAAADNLRRYYFDPGIAQKTANSLLAQEKNGADDAANTGAAFAALLTQQMRAVSNDTDLIVEYSAAPLPMKPVPPPDAMARYRQAMLRQNCTIAKVETLPHNIGYLKLNSFPDTSICEKQAAAAMAALNHADALIVDLRDNAGGYPDMVSFVASYLFDHPSFWYSPRGGPSLTSSPVPGNHLANKPVYVLTSSATWSAAEQFSYDLKMLHRATLIGETTRGGAHAGVFHRIDDHFGMGIPEIHVPNPYSSHDWEGVGVAPDVQVIAADALTTAEKLAVRRITTSSR